MPKRLLIPGTGGSVLKDAEGRTISILQLVQGQDEELTMDNPLTASGVIRDAYNPFVTSINPKYETFPYDWRQDIRSSGSQFWQYLQQNRGDEKFNVDCHSQGGLVFLWAAREARRANQKFHDFVEQVAFIGVPFFGTINSATALLSGSEPFWRAHIGKEIVRTWPSIYMMLADWDVGLAGPAGQLFLDATWAAADMLSPIGSPLNLVNGIDASILSQARDWVQERSSGFFTPLADFRHIMIVQG